MDKRCERRRLDVLRLRLHDARDHRTFAVAGHLARGRTDEAERVARGYDGLIRYLRRRVASAEKKVGVCKCSEIGGGGKCARGE